MCHIARPKLLLSSLLGEMWVLMLLPCKDAPPPSLMIWVRAVRHAPTHSLPPSLTAPPHSAIPSLVQNIDGKLVKMDQFKGKVVLIVNLASQVGGQWVVLIVNLGSQVGGGGSALQPHTAVRSRGTPPSHCNHSLVATITVAGFPPPLR